MAALYWTNLLFVTLHMTYFDVDIFYYMLYVFFFLQISLFIVQFTLGEMKFRELETWQLIDILLLIALAYYLCKIEICHTGGWEAMGWKQFDLKDRNNEVVI